MLDLGLEAVVARIASGGRDGGIDGDLDIQFSLRRLMSISKILRKPKP